MCVCDLCGVSLLFDLECWNLSVNVIIGRDCSAELGHLTLQSKSATSLASATQAKNGIEHMDHGDANLWWQFLCAFHSSLIVELWMHVANWMTQDDAGLRGQWDCAKSCIFLPPKMANDGVTTNQSTQVIPKTNTSFTHGEPQVAEWDRLPAANRWNCEILYQELSPQKNAELPKTCG